MKFKPTKILSIDNQYPTRQQMSQIENSKCIQCKEKFKEFKHIAFVDLDNGLIWWHVKDRSIHNDTAPCKGKVPCYYKTTNVEVLKRHKRERKKKLIPTF